MPDDDGGIPLFPTGGGTAARAAQFSSETARKLRRFANNPAALVISVVSGFVVTVIFGFFEFLIGAVLYPFDLLVGGLGWIQRQLVLAFAFVGFDILGTLRALQQMLGGVVEGAGPAAPLVVAVVTGGLIFVLYRLTVAGLELVPGGSSIMALLGR